MIENKIIVTNIPEYQAGIGSNVFFIDSFKNDEEKDRFIMDMLVEHLTDERELVFVITPDTDLENLAADYSAECIKI